MRDPVGTIRAFYEKYGIPFTAETEKAMAAYLANNRGDRYGKFVYSLDVIGEDIDALHREFAPYRERFGLEIEARQVAGSLMHDRISVNNLCFPGAPLATDHRTLAFAGCASHRHSDGEDERRRLGPVRRCSCAVRVSRWRRSST